MSLVTKPNAGGLSSDVALLWWEDCRANDARDPQEVVSTCPDGSERGVFRARVGAVFRARVGEMYTDRGWVWLTSSFLFSLEAKNDLYSFYIIRGRRWILFYSLCRSGELSSLSLHTSNLIGMQLGWLAVRRLAALHCSSRIQSFLQRLSVPNSPGIFATLLWTVKVS